MKILIAEDNAFSRTLLKKTLTKAGYDVIAAENGEAAWEVLQQDEVPKLALIDWMMPGMSGVELCRKIREVDSALPIYVILLTAKSGKEDVLEGFAAGADDFIKKPFDSGELLARIHVGRRLVEQHALLHCLIDSIPDPIYFKDNRGLYLGCNKAYSEFVGKEEVDMINRPVSDILAAKHAQASHMEDLRVLANATQIETEGWMTNADGQEVYHSTLKIPYLESAAGSTGMIGISRDLTKRIRMEQEVKRLAVAVEQSTESIVITDVDGIILYVNAAFESTTGYSTEGMLGQTPRLLKSDKHEAAFYQKLWETISAGSMWEGRITNRKKDGSLFDVEAVIYPIRDDDEKVVNYVSISRDITQEMAIEKQLRQTQKMNAIGELAGGVSHDFNNILTAILGYVALCMNAVEEDSKTYGYLKEIVKAGDRAAKLVRQILTFSRQEEQDFHSVALQPVIADSLSMVQTTIKSNIKVETDIDDSCGPIFGDTTQIQQVVVNLCTNAVHALGKEEGALSVSLKQIELLGKKHGERMVDLEPGLYACITVGDTGCGMAPETLDRIFEPYYTTKKKGEGTGFGLSIVHGIARKHRGCIAVESELGEGTTFYLYIPLLIGTAEEERRAMDLSTPEGFGRILFVDDDDAVLSMGREILESFGYTVATATNGKRALKLFRQDPDAFDALVSDYSMPEMNGHELISECLLLRSGLPAILCSGYMEKADGESLKDLGKTVFMPKPLDWRKLSRTLQREINKQD
ncbi:MAG: response regulator [Verrucomicrobia bacterium]|nr:response regulator [Verrucomicrobiota bacterium]